jgi:hypothetical protein
MGQAVKYTRSSAITLFLGVKEEKQLGLELRI